MSASTRCRICEGKVEEFLDFGRQPLSDHFPTADQLDDEFFFRLAVGICESCTMVQLMEEVQREKMFHEEYPYLSSGSDTMRRHFAATAEHLLASHLRAQDAFIVELGCNDGVMLKTVADAGVRHLGIEPSGGVAAIARDRGVRVWNEFFEKPVAEKIVEAEGQADVIYAANTFCHIPYMNSIFEGVRSLLAPDGVFVFEDPYFAEIVHRTSFDQVYDEHFFFFTARSVSAMAAHYGFELVDVERLSVHGGEVRYTLTHAGARTPAPRVAEMIAEEDALGLSDLVRLGQFASAVATVRDDLKKLLEDLRAQGKRVVAYGATAKSATVANYCGIGPELVEFVCDTTPAKQGRLTPGSHIPVRPAEAFADPFPDYALLFAWNHAEEIMAKEKEFKASGGQWILYVPKVHVV